MLPLALIQRDSSSWIKPNWTMQLLSASILTCSTARETMPSIDRRSLVSSSSVWNMNSQRSASTWANFSSEYVTLGDCNKMHTPHKVEWLECLLKSWRHSVSVWYTSFLTTSRSPLWMTRQSLQLIYWSQHYRSSLSTWASASSSLRFRQRYSNIQKRRLKTRQKNRLTKARYAKSMSPCLPDEVWFI